MESEQSHIDGLVTRPAEGLNVEIKQWIDPDAPGGIAKIVKAVFAIRNRNGGYLIIGFDDQTWAPSADPPRDVRAVFTIDKIQGLVSKYASEPFQVTTCFGKRDGQEYPVVVIPEGVRIPVAANRDLVDGANTLIHKDTIYFRTLRSNGVPSTSAARSVGKFLPGRHMIDGAN